MRRRHGFDGEQPASAPRWGCRFAHKRDHSGRWPTAIHRDRESHRSQPSGHLEYLWVELHWHKLRRALLAEQVWKFTLERVEENGKVTFKANGNIDFFGEEAFTRVGGAGGQNRTGYARLFRAALYQ